MNRCTRSSIAELVVICAVTTACVGGTSIRSEDARSISVFGPYQGYEADQFARSVAAFTEDTGIVVQYTGSSDFTSDLLKRTGEAKRPPDVALVPQPGVVRELVDDDELVALQSETLAELDSNYRPDTRLLGEVSGVAYGVPFRTSIKSLVWYRPSVFDENAWAIPASLEDLEQLSAEIASTDGISPWCLALAAGTATGWPATDWVEDLMIRAHGPDTYRRWALGAEPFSSVLVAGAFAQFQLLVLQSGRLSGGTGSAVQTPFAEVMRPLMADPPGCAMAKQADFASDWFPEGTSIGPDGDVDWFVLPTHTTMVDPPPLVVGGDLAVQFRRSPEIDAFMTFLAGPDTGAPWASAGGFLSPKSTFDPTNYRTDDERRLAQLLTDADDVVFDASDEMPAEIGSDLLWSGITLWVNGQITYDELAADLDEAIAAGGRPDPRVRSRRGAPST
jgi:alpha-glucoside transport system substrate-binding protein